MYENIISCNRMIEQHKRIAFQYVGYSFEDGKTSKAAKASPYYLVNSNGSITFSAHVTARGAYPSPTRWSKVKIDMREMDINDQYFRDNYDCLSDEIAGNQALLKARIHFNCIV